MNYLYFILLCQHNYAQNEQFRISVMLIISSGCCQLTNYDLTRCTANGSTRDECAFERKHSDGAGRG